MKPELIFIIKELREKEGKSIEALIALIGTLATLGGAFYMKSKSNNQKDKDKP